MLLGEFLRSISQPPLPPLPSFRFWGHKYMFSCCFYVICTWCTYLHAVCTTPFSSSDTVGGRSLDMHFQFPFPTFVRGSKMGYIVCLSFVFDCTLMYSFGSNWQGDSVGTYNLTPLKVCLLHLLRDRHCGNISPPRSLNFDFIMGSNL